MKNHIAGAGKKVGDCDASPPSIATTRKVKAPAGYANAGLNGLRVMPVSSFENIVNTIIVDGELAGKRWQFNADHLEEI